MLILLPAFLSTLGSMFRARSALQLENLALRHQIGVLKRSVGKRPKLTAADRLFWVFLRRIWDNWRSALNIVQPATVIAWHRKGFRLFWTWKIRHGQVGRPAVACEVRDLIRKHAWLPPTRAAWIQKLESQQHTARVFVGGAGQNAVAEGLSQV